MDTSVNFGQKGEKIALEYLLEKKYLILETNYRSGKNEVDIIAKDKGEIVFIEVKTRSNNVFCEPESAVKKNKQRAIIKVANSYILRNNVNEEARFDIIAIVTNSEGVKINHIERAFTPMPY
jgi:putative endonuclease